MKKRFLTLLILIAILLGILVVFSLVKAFTPSWVYNTVALLSLLSALWYATKPPKTHYWYFSCVEIKDGKSSFGFGIMRTKSEDFNYSFCHRGDEPIVILSVKEISKKQYELLSQTINNKAEQ